MRKNAKLKTSFNTQTHKMFSKTSKRAFKIGIILLSLFLLPIHTVKAEEFLDIETEIHTWDEGNVCNFRTRQSFNTNDLTKLKLSKISLYLDDRGEVVGWPNIPKICLVTTPWPQKNDVIDSDCLGGLIESSNFVNNGWYDFIFDTPEELLASTTYWVISGTGLSTDVGCGVGMGANSYNGGYAGSYNSEYTDYDFMIKIYSFEPEPEPEPELPLCELPDNTVIQRITGCMNVYTTSTSTPSETREWQIDIPMILFIFVYLLGAISLGVIYIYIFMKKRK